MILRLVGIIWMIAPFIMFLFGKNITGETIGIGIFSFALGLFAYNKSKENSNNNIPYSNPHTESGNVKLESKPKPISDLFINNQKSYDEDFYKEEEEIKKDEIIEIKPNIEIPDWIIFDSYDDSYKLLAKAKITRISEKSFNLNNDNKTEYRLADVEVTMPHDSSVQEGTTMIYQSLIDLMGYEKGDEVTLLVQIEGEYAGYSKVYLPNSEEIENEVFNNEEDGINKINSKADPKYKGIKKIGFEPPQIFKQNEPYSYPVVKMPNPDSFIKFPRKGRTNKLGYTEKSFFKELQRHFSSEFEVYNDRHIPHKSNNNIYEPDFLLINDKNDKNIFINIEIDEPYDGISRIPTHELNRDTYRDLFFTKRGYVVIRFTEKQIFEEAKQCCKFISKVIKSIDSSYVNKKLELLNNNTTQKQWDSLQAKQWASEKYREKYLGIESFKPKAFTDFEFIFEDSELDNKVESEIIEINLNNIAVEDNKPLNGNRPHLRDKRIVFDPIKHKYYIDGNPDTISVSELIDKFFPEFDAMSAAKNLNPNHQYYGYPVEDVVKIWKQKGLEAAELGTNLHLQIENYYKSLPNDSESEEFEYFLDFKRRYSSMKPHRTEWRIFDEDYLIAGTVDMVYEKEDGTYYMFDWKRSEKVINHEGKPKLSDPMNYYTRFASGDLSHLTDDSYNKYALQQNIYRHILERKYGFKVSSMNLLILHPTYKTYHWLKIPKMKEEVNYMFETFKKIS